MTSLVLISPVDEANKFNVRFRDPIKIKKNSKVYLNYASFTRLNNARFNGNQQLTLTSNFIVPTHRLDDTTIENNLNLISTVNTFDNELNEFVLSPIQLETSLNTALNNICINQLKDYKPYVKDALVMDLTAQTTEHHLGLVYKTYGQIEYTENLNNSHGYGQGTPLVGTSRLKTSPTDATNPFYDNFSISNKSYYPFQLGSNNIEEFQRQMKGFSFMLNTRTIEDLTGKISIGLFSDNMMEHTNAFNGWINKTRGTTTHHNNASNPGIFRPSEGVQLNITDADFNTVKGDCILGSFLTVELDGATNLLKLFLPTNPAGDTPKLWANINQQIFGMREIFQHDFTDDTTFLNEPIRISIQFYNDLGDATHKTDNFKVFFKLYIKDKDEDDENNMLLYDSYDDDYYFNKSFFTGLNVNEGGLTLPQRQARIKSQSPFNIMLSATTQGEGAFIDFAPFEMSGNLDTPTSILLDYNLSFSSEIANIVDTDETINLYPNTYESLEGFIKVFLFSDFRSILNGLSYDIYLNNLPIKNYKNKENSSDGGFIKQIVATCPLPFNQNNTTNINRGRIIGLYEPNNLVKLSLDNQEITLNNIDVEIKTSHNERPAFELEKVMLNIVIEE